MAAPFRYPLVVLTTLMSSLCLSQGALAAEQEDLAPYKMLRSLQFVQDSIVSGDQSASDMQRFMLGNIDARLRALDPSVFDDDRNVDAALIYAMSGGNPATLEYLIARDVRGNFDNRVTDILRKYFDGKGLMVVRALTDTATEYQDKRIGPYLSLVAGNVLIAKDPLEALKRYDIARLNAPGTIIEEAALRRSLAIANDKNLVERGLGFAQLYARRFLHSPYASQFADLFVGLVVAHDEEVKQDDINTILAFMDEPRRREVYLRIARAAAISGKGDLAIMAANKARSLSPGDDDPFGALADFYGGMAALSTDRAGDVARNLVASPQTALSVRDQNLRDAARSVAQQILAPPDPASLKQDSQPIPSEGDLPSASPSEHKTDAQAPLAMNDHQPAPQADAGSSEIDKTMQSFLSGGQTKLDEIDGLLKQERY